jgi:hypothetical protein
MGLIGTSGAKLKSSADERAQVPNQLGESFRSK